MVEDRERAQEAASATGEAAAAGLPVGLAVAVASGWLMSGQRQPSSLVPQEGVTVPEA